MAYHNNNEKYSFKSITNNPNDLILLESYELLSHIKKRNKKINSFLDSSDFINRNKTPNYNEFLEILYTLNHSMSLFIYPMIQEITLKEGLKVIILNCEAFPIWDPFYYEDPLIDNNVIVINFNSIPELIKKIQTLDVIIEESGGHIALVICDKINYYFDRNIYIHITENYFNEEYRELPQISLKRNNEKKKRSGSIKNSNFPLMQAAILKLFDQQIKFNFNLFLTQYDFSREKFLSSLKFLRDKNMDKFYKEKFLEKYTFNYQVNLSNRYQIQFILPNEDLEDEEIVFGVLTKRDKGTNFIFLDNSGNYLIKEL